MPRYICQFEDGDQRWLLEWSTIVEAPVTWGMTEEEFRSYYQTKYGTDEMEKLGERLARVEAKGTSARHYDDLDDLIFSNRAGHREAHLDKEGIIEFYCRRKEDPPPNP